MTRSNVYVRRYKPKNGGRPRYTLIVRQAGHKEHYIPLGPVSSKVAKDRCLEVVNELHSGKFKKEPSVHLYLSEFVQKFFDDFANGSRAPKTVKNYRERLKPILARFKGYRLNQISSQLIEAYLTGQEVSGRTKNIDLSILRLVCKKAVEWGYLMSNPTLGIKRFPESNGGSRALTPQELSVIWDGLTPWQKSVILIMVNSGMRPGELSNLKFEDINWEDKTLAVVSDKSRKTKNLKTRYIPLNQDLKEELLFLKENLPVMRGKCCQGYKLREPHQMTYIFCHENGGKVASFRRSITNAFKKHGIRGVTPHGLRKTFCSLLARHKVHPKVAQELMGHSDVKLTMNVYTQIDDQQKREAVNVLPSIHDMRKQTLHVA